MSSTADRIAPMSKRIENEAVYGELRRRIIDLDLAPGTRLREQNLADEFGISRTPIRRILDRLANDGLVSMSPGTGAAVSVVDFGALREVWAIRMKVAELLGDVIVLPAPARIALRGDVRSFDSATQDLIEARLEQLASGICLANGATHELTNNREFAATVNSAREATVVAEIVGADRVLPDHPPLMASEDFGFMLQESPAPMPSSATAPPEWRAAGYTARPTISTMRCCHWGLRSGLGWSKPNWPAHDTAPDPTYETAPTDGPATGVHHR